MSRGAGIRIGLHYTYPHDAPAEDVLPLYRDMGLDEIDVLMGTPEVGADDEGVCRLVARARQLGVPAGAVSPRWGWFNRVLRDASSMAQMRAFIEAAPAFGTKRVMMSCPSEAVTSVRERDEHLERVVAVYRPLAEV